MGSLFRDDGGGAVFGDMAMVAPRGSLIHSRWKMAGRGNNWKEARMIMGLMDGR